LPLVGCQIPFARFFHLVEPNHIQIKTVDADIIILRDISLKYETEIIIRQINWKYNTN